MKTRTWLRRLALAAAVTVTVTGAGVGAPAAEAFPVDPCSDYADCNTVGGHISRATVIRRAMLWVDSGQPYSQAVQDAYNGTGQNLQHKWRRDCSGYVSMAWRLRGKPDNYGRYTGNLHEISTEIGFRSLKRGDILVDPDGGPGYPAHVMIFDGWVNGTVGGDFHMIEENPAYSGAVRHRASSVTYLQNGGIKGRDDAGDNFTPRRYNKITDS